MVARELADGDAAYDRASLWHALTGEGEPYASEPDDLVALRERRAARACCAAAASRSWRPRPARPGRCAARTSRTILFLEDVDEPPYRVDRMLRQLRASGALRGRARASSSAT